MSKRHTNIVEQPPVPIGLRFYAPMLENDLADRVSGVTPTRGTAQVSFDSNEQAYRIITTTGGQLAFIYNIQNVNVYTLPYTYTYIIKVKVNSFSGTCDLITVGKTGAETTSSALIETHRYTGFTTGSWQTIALTCQGSDLVFYLDSQIVRTSTTSVYTGCNPNSWNTPDKQNNLTICGGFFSYHYDAFVKDVYVFDRVLTQQEIQQYNI